MLEILGGSARVRLAFEGASRKGLLEACANEAGIAVDICDHPDVRIPLRDFIRFLDAASTRDPLFAARSGMKYDKKYAGLLGYSMMNSPNVRDALGVLAKYSRRMVQGAAFVLREGPQSSQIVYEVTSSQCSSPLLEEFSAVCVAGFLRKAAGLDITPVRLELSSTPAVPAEVYEAEIGWPVSYGCPASAVVIRTDDLDRPIPGADASLFRVLEQALNEISGPDEDDETLSTVRARIAARLATCGSSIEDVAEQMGMSVRTLQRRLDAAGVSFRAVTDDVRLDQARHHLTMARTPVAEISNLLGYSEPAAFVRAFRRWTGTTPTDYRRQMTRSATRPSQMTQDVIRAVF